MLPMAFGSCLFCVLVASTAVHGQTPTPSVTVIEDSDTTSNISTTTEIINQIPSDQFVVELNFTLKEDQLSGIVNYLLLNDLGRYLIKTNDIIQLSGIDKDDFDQTRTISFLADAFGLTTEKIYTVNSLEVFLNALDIKFGEFYNTLAAKLDIKLEDLEKIEEVFSINSGELVVAIARGGNAYNILRNGIYTEENANKALDLIPNKSWNDIFLAAKNICLSSVLKISSESFMEILTSNGWNRNVHKKVWDKLPITTELVYSVPVFQHILEDINKQINKNITIGVLVDSNKVVIHKEVYDAIDEQILGSTVEILANGIQVDHKNPKRVGKNIYQLNLKEDSLNSIEITQKYEEFKNCYYFLWVNEEVQVIAMEVTKKFEGIKNGTKFQLGAPLVCDSLLYGLAKEDAGELILFDRFFTLDDDIVSSSMMVGSNLVLVIGGVVLKKIWFC